MLKGDFMDWKPLNEVSLKEVPEVSRICWIRCCDMSIQRLHGIDKDGILTFGESNNSKTLFELLLVLFQI